ncbi:hypothetical protein [Hydrogenobaculum acidophilum]
MDIWHSILHFIHMLEGTPYQGHTHCYNCMFQTGQVPNVFKMYAQRLVETVIIGGFLIVIFSKIVKHEEDRIDKEN